MQGKQQVALDLGKNMTDLLQQLAAAMGTTIENLFPYYCQAVATEAMMKVIGCSVAFVLSCFLCATFSYALITVKLDKPETQETANIILTIASAIFAIAALLCFIVFIMHSPTWFAQWHSPESFAVQRLFQDIALLTK